MINNWKRALIDSAPDIFDKGQKARKQNEAKVDDLYRQIGQLKVENDFLSKISVSKRQAAKADGGGGPQFIQRIMSGRCPVASR